MTQDISQIKRYRSQSLQLLDKSLSVLRSGRWSQTEELLWGSLMLAVKSHALCNGKTISNQETAQNYAYEIGIESNERTITESFKQLSGFSDTLERVQDERTRVDYLFLLLDDVSAGVEKIWDLIEEITFNKDFQSGESEEYDL